VAPEDRAPISIQQAHKPAARRKLWFFGVLSVIAGVAGVNMLRGHTHISADVRSGSPGYRKSPMGKELHWENKAITVYLDSSLQHIGPAANEAVMQAFGQWVASDPRLPDVTFDTGQTSSLPIQDGKSTVSYGRITAPGHEHDVAVTITYANDQTGAIIEADMVLNSLYPVGVLTAKTPTQTVQSTSNGNKQDSSSSKSMLGNSESSDCANRYDAQNVATHEAGHFFGLGEDLTEKRATMFQSIDQCETHKRVLAGTDVTALTTLYAASADPEEAQAGPRACSFGGVPTGGGAGALSAAIFGLALLRRRRGR